jgi:hypothetical protein
MNWVHMVKVSWREYDSFLVKGFGRRNRRATGGEKDGFRDTPRFVTSIPSAASEMQSTSELK